MSSISTSSPRCSGTLAITVLSAVVALGMNARSAGLQPTNAATSRSAATSWGNSCLQNAEPWLLLDRVLLTALCAATGHARRALRPVHAPIEKAQGLQLAVPLPGVRHGVRRAQACAKRAVVDEGELVKIDEKVLPNCPPERAGCLHGLHRLLHGRRQGRRHRGPRLAAQRHKVLHIAACKRAETGRGGNGFCAGGAFRRRSVVSRHLAGVRNCQRREVWTASCLLTTSAQADGPGDPHVEMAVHEDSTSCSVHVLRHASAGPRGVSEKLAS